MANILAYADLRVNRYLVDTTVANTALEYVTVYFKFKCISVFYTSHATV